MGFLSAINPRKIGLKLDNDSNDVKEKLGQLKDTIIDEFELETIRDVYNVPIDVDMNFDPNPILWTLENTLIPIRGHQTVPLL